jgi:hypothetical protein
MYACKKYMYKYIHVYIYKCVCVCVFVSRPASDSPPRRERVKCARCTQASQRLFLELRAAAYRGQCTATLAAMDERLHENASRREALLTQWINVCSLLCACVRACAFVCVCVCVCACEDACFFIM